MRMSINSTENIFGNPPLHLKFKVLTPGAQIPKQGDEKAACYDLACPKGTKPVETNGNYLMVPLGFAISIPEGFHAKIYPRSSLPLRYNATLGNCVGIIDSGFLNEWKLIIHPEGWADIDMYEFIEACKAGANLAQVEFVENGRQVLFDPVEDFGNDYDRGGGFGSTGK